MKIYSYVVDHDEGREPKPYFGTCTLCRCKYSETAEKTHGQRGRKNIVELAEKGDWVIGTGGLSGRSAGHGKLIYAMRVDEKLPREEYYNDLRFAKKKPERPLNNFQKHEQFALISEHFYYFGKKAIDILKFKLEKNPRGFHCVDLAEFDRFREWLEAKYKPGIHGEPCYLQPVDKPKGSERCKSSC